MLPEIINFFKRHKDLLVLAVIVFLLCLLCFGLGMLTQFYLQKPPLTIENPTGE